MLGKSNLKEVKYMILLVAECKNSSFSWSNLQQNESLFCV